MKTMKTMPKLLAKYNRTKRDSAPEELRVTVGEYNGIKYLDFRLWNRDRDGDWFPTTRGITVRESEIDDVSDVLAVGGKFLANENAVRRGKASPLKSPAKPAPALTAVTADPRSVPPWEAIPA